MTLWDLIQQRTEQTAAEMRFGQLEVTLRFHIRDGRLIRVDTQYIPHQSISVEDVKGLDRRKELA